MKLLYLPPFLHGEFVSGDKFSAKLFALNFDNVLSDCEDFWGDYVSEKMKSCTRCIAAITKARRLTWKFLMNHWAAAEGSYTKGTFRSITVTKGAHE